MHNNGIISKPINVRADIAYVLGENSGDVGTLCKSSKINKWAKYKPTRKRGVNPTDAWWGEEKSIHGVSSYSCGLSLNDYSLAELKAALDANTQHWLYEKPRGNSVSAGEYFRVLDFDGYVHNAGSPFISLHLGTYGTGEDATPSLEAVYSASEGALGLSDFGILQDRYFGFAMYDTNGNFKGIGTASDKIGSNTPNSFRCHVAMPSTDGSYYLYPFFSYQAQEWSTQNQFTIESFIPLPFGRQTVSVVNNVAKVVASGTIHYLGSSIRNNITYDIALFAKPLESTTFSYVKVQVGMTTGSGFAWYREYTIDTGRVIVAGGSASLTGAIKQQDLDDNNNSISNQEFYDMYNSGGKMRIHYGMPNMQGLVIDYYTDYISLTPSTT